MKSHKYYKKIATIFFISLSAVFIYGGTINKSDNFDLVYYNSIYSVFPSQFYYKEVIDSSIPAQFNRIFISCTSTFKSKEIGDPYSTGLLLITFCADDFLSENTDGTQSRPNYDPCKIFSNDSLVSVSLLNRGCGDTTLLKFTMVKYLELFHEFIQSKYFKLMRRIRGTQKHGGGEFLTSGLNLYNPTTRPSVRVSSNDPLSIANREVVTSLSMMASLQEGRYAVYDSLLPVGDTLYAGVSIRGGSMRWMSISIVNMADVDNTVYSEAYHDDSTLAVTWLDPSNRIMSQTADKYVTHIINNRQMIKDRIDTAAPTNRGKSMWFDFIIIPAK